jgi:methylenetetrahydrofolate dehydrogenase (NADP+)/methenyltetrahydrofolate cyclohydrolase
VQVLEGAPVAKKIRDDARREAARISPPPSLAVVLLGHDPASEAYVASKSRAAEEAGIRATTVRLPSGSTPEALLGAVRSAGADPSVDGVLVQMPLESGHDPARVVDALDPYKDVDGLHPENVGLLHEGRPRFVPCTPAGILALLDHYGVTLEGARAVVVGRSSLVGRPLAALLMARNATVTVCHSKTRDLPAVCQEADVLVAAIGRPGLVTSEFVRPGATVVDVGINRTDEGLVGDVAPDAGETAGLITPVPGGVGPMTIAALLRNTVKAARYQAGVLAFPGA